MWLPGASQQEREPAERPTVYTSQMPGLPPASRAYGRWTCVLLLLLCGLAAQGAWAQCRIVTEKASVEDVAVEFSALSFSLDLKGVPATVELEETGSGQQAFTCSLLCVSQRRILPRSLSIASSEAWTCTAAAFIWESRPAIPGLGSGAMACSSRSSRPWTLR